MCLGLIAISLLWGPINLRLRACAGVRAIVLPGGCAGVFSSVVFLAVIIGGTTVPAAFMYRGPGVLTLFAESDFGAFL